MLEDDDDDNGVLGVFSRKTVSILKEEENTIRNDSGFMRSASAEDRMGILCSSDDE